VCGGGVQGLQGFVARAIATKGSRVLGFALKKENDSNLTIGTKFKVSTIQDYMS